ncbi:hypothetical protein, partial [Bartonella sp. CM100XJJH]|uniref:hypothetical protein n=1 Tax=Bartonella sp. CM100XJJH TaxID=3243543 RepID=UPI0035CFEE37
MFMGYPALCLVFLDDQLRKEVFRALFKISTMPIFSDEQLLMFFERGILKDYGLAKLSDMR